MSQTNFEKWRLYTQGLVSPDIYIDFAFYYLIAASLQRRVWIGPPHMPLFPNIYLILVGNPGVGKGLVVKQIYNILHYHKMADPVLSKKLDLAKTPEERLMVETLMQQDFERAQQAESRFTEGKAKKNVVFEKPLLFPVAADASTYEALVKAMGTCLRRISYRVFDESIQKEIIKPYTHSSICFCLEEIASLFRKRTEDLVNFLLTCYDCGDYIYDTKTQGKDIIKKCCLNFFGGTTPSFMQETFDDKLLTEGFSSRTFFIYASQNRKREIWVPDLSEDQSQAYKDILNHIEKLSHLYGRVHVKDEDKEWLREWWINSETVRPNPSIKLNSYYSRKNIHVQKLAMAIHFAESTEMVLERASFEKAIEMLAHAERVMHHALGLDNNNPLAKPARKMVQFIESNGRQTRKDLFAEFWEQVPNPKENIDEILEFLQAQGKVKRVEDDDPKMAGIVIYDVMRRESKVSIGVV